jgi:hypothetical protein
VHAETTMAAKTPMPTEAAVLGTAAQTTVAGMLATGGTASGDRQQQKHERTESSFLKHGTHIGRSAKPVMACEYRP